MDIQLLVVLALFVAALFLLGRRFYRQFSGKKQAGCEKCLDDHAPGQIKNSEQ